jgi:hypothetical protein
MQSAPRIPRICGMALLFVFAPAIAFAHPGDHAAMTAAEVAHHIATSPDHMLEIGFLVMMGVGQLVRIRRRAAR